MQNNTNEEQHELPSESVLNILGKEDMDTIEQAMKNIVEEVNQLKKLGAQALDGAKAEWEQRLDG